MSTTKIIVELEIEGEPSDAESVVDSALDAGHLQDAINDHDCDGVGPLRVLSATCRVKPAGTRRDRKKCPGRISNGHADSTCAGNCCTACGGPIDEEGECRCP
jgi:hypothetical protein